MNKTIHVCFLMAVLFGTLVFAKNIDSDDKKTTGVQQVVITVSEGTSVYNISAFENAKIVILTDKNDTSESDVQKGEIFVSEGTVIYNLEGLENTKILKINPEKKIKKKKPAEEKKRIAVVCSNKIKLHPSIITLNPIQDPQKLSQSEKEKIVYFPNRIQSFSNDIIREITTASKKRAFKREKHLITYQNPNIAIFSFSGRYSVRPPTFL